MVNNVERNVQEDVNSQDENDEPDMEVLAAESVDESIRCAQSEYKCDTDVSKDD